MEKPRHRIRQTNWTVVGDTQWRCDTLIGGELHSLLVFCVGSVVGRKTRRGAIGSCHRRRSLYEDPAFERARKHSGTKCNQPRLRLRSSEQNVIQNWLFTEETSLSYCDSVGFWKPGASRLRLTRGRKLTLMLYADDTRLFC